MENKKYNFDDIDFDDLEFDDIEDEFSYLEEFDDLTSPAEQPTMAAHRATVYPRTPVTERAPSRPPVYTPVPTAEPTPVTSEPVSTPEPVSSAATKMMHLIFVIIFFVITVIPVFGMIFNLGGENAENRNMAKMPALFVSSSDSSTVLNEKFPAQFEEYISDNFGFRQEIISLWSAAQYFVFNESAVEDVIVGENDWLFYTSTKADYEGTNLYTDRTIFRLAKTVELMDRYVTDSGAVFAFTVAPNKATVYPEYMSRKCIPSQVTNLSRLSEALNDKEYFIDLVELFNQTLDRSTQYYYRYDSHWNNVGALEVYRTFQKYFAERIEGYEYDDYSGGNVFVDSTRTSDLSTMLLPQLSMTEPDMVYNIPVLYSSETPITNRLAVSIRTACPDAPSSLYMFRDSFASSLIDTFSNNYGRVVYSRALPYNLTAAIDEQYGAVVVEIVERNMLEIIRRAPIADAPPCPAPETVTDSDATVTGKQSSADGRLTVSGILDQSIPLADTDCIYIEFRGENQQTFFEAFPICDGDAECDRGFTLTIPEAELLQGTYYMYVHVGTPEQTTAYALYM